MILNLYNTKDVPPAFGLNNRGATCWFNAILQLIYSLPALHAVAYEFEMSSSKNKFIKIMNKLFNNYNYGDNLAAIHKYLTDTYGHISLTNLSSQECAAEGFDLIIDALNIPQVQKVFVSVHQMSFDCNECLERISITRDLAYRIDLFGMETSIKPIDNVVMFQEYITNHISIVDEYKCDKCHQVIHNVKRVERLCQAHEILVFTFNKFYEKSKIWFPEEFSLPYTYKERKGRLHYKLVAKVEHCGTRNGGHYFAHCLRNDSKWYCLNDSLVTSGTSAPTQETFLIAYHAFDIKYFI